MERTIRVLVAKPGLDGHDRGALVVAQGLRDAGMEVIYTGLRQTPEQIAAIAVQEDVDCVGLSSLSGAHMQLFPEVVRQLRRLGADDILVIGGGVIPQEDFEFLYQNGVHCVFTPGTPISTIVSFIKENVRRNVYSLQPDSEAESAATVPTEVAVPNVANDLESVYLKAERVDHIGIAVHKIEDVLPWYTRQLGMQVVHEETVPDQQVRVIFVQVQDLVLELLEPLVSDSPVAKHLEKRGPGLHHIAFRVQNLEHALAEAKELGYRLIDEKPRKGARGKWIAFLHPKDTGGVLTELCQKIVQEESHGA
jgi:methylmalonyl-CoA mutase, C-terminal domain